MIKNADLKEMKELLEKDIRLQYIAVRSDESRRYTEIGRASCRERVF